MKGNLCTNCGKNYTSSPDHELCYDCWRELEEQGFDKREEKFFQDDFTKSTTVYITFNGQSLADIGWTNDLRVKLEELKKKWPTLHLVYFREFVREFDAKKFSGWLNTLDKNVLNEFIEEYKRKLNLLKF